MIFKIHLGGNEAGKCLCHCDDAAQAMHTCILQTRYKLVYTRAARSPHNLFLMFLMFLLSHHGCFHLAKGRNALGEAARPHCSGRSREVARCWPFGGLCAGGPVCQASCPSWPVQSCVCSQCAPQLPGVLLCCGKGCSACSGVAVGLSSSTHHWMSVGVCGWRGQA